MLLAISLLSALTYPSMAGLLERERLRAAIRLVVVDLHSVRGEAVRSGRSTSLRFTRLGGEPRCYAHVYQIVVLEPSEQVVRTRHLPLRAGACLDVGPRRDVVFHPWGLLRGGDNRKIRIRSGALADSVVISSVGRIHRY